MLRMELSLGVLIKYICEELQRQGNAKLKAWDLTFPQMIVLMELDAAEGKQCFLKDLEKELRVAQSTAAGIIARLEKKGYAESLSMPNDKRVKIVHLTEKGQARCNSCKGVISQSGVNLVNGFSQEELEDLLYLLQKMAENLEKKI